MTIRREWQRPHAKLAVLMPTNCQVERSWMFLRTALGPSITYGVNRCQLNWGAKTAISRPSSHAIQHPGEVAKLLRADVSVVRLG
jgi:hypothetical protein